MKLSNSKPATPATALRPLRTGVRAGRWYARLWSMIDRSEAPSGPAYVSGVRG